MTLILKEEILLDPKTSDPTINTLLNTLSSDMFSFYCKVAFTIVVIFYFLYIQLKMKSHEVYSDLVILGFIIVALVLALFLHIKKALLILSVKQLYDSLIVTNNFKKLSNLCFGLYLFFYVFNYTINEFLMLSLLLKLAPAIQKFSILLLIQHMIGIKKEKEEDLSFFFFLIYL